MIKLIRNWYRFNILRFFIKKPIFLSWEKNNFNHLKKWAQCQKHPNDHKKTLWDYIYDNDSVWIITNLKMYLKNINEK